MEDESFDKVGQAAARETSDEPAEPLLHHVGAARETSEEPAVETAPASEEVEEDSEIAHDSESAPSDVMLQGDDEQEVSDVDLTMAWALLGFVTFNMVLFYLVNYPDQDMRLYVWSVVNVTISIFMAVLIFSSVTEFLSRVIFKEVTTAVKIIVAFVQLIVYFVAMQVAVAFLCGVLENDPFPSTLSHEEVLQAMHKRERRMKSVSGLLAHMAGFALINFGGALQHMSWEFQHRPLAFVFIPALFFSHLITTRFVRKTRRSIMRKRVTFHHRAHADQYEPMHSDHPPGSSPEAVEEEQEEEKQGMDWATDKWDEETYECENEIASIGMSFLVVQACRFNITGVMPNNLGIEEEFYVHPVDCIVKLAGCGVMFVVCCLGLVVYLHFFEMQTIEPGTCKSFAKRMMKVLELSSAMAFAWCLQNTIKWSISKFAAMHGMNPDPNGIIARVLMSVTISFLAFFIIVALDFIYDQDCTGETADEAISSLIRALSLLVGFCWEQSFDCCVEVLAAKSVWDPLIMESILTVSIIALVYPAWRKYIIEKVLVLTRERHVRLMREKRRHHHHD